MRIELHLNHPKQLVIQYVKVRKEKNTPKNVINEH